MIGTLEMGKPVGQSLFGADAVARHALLRGGDRQAFGEDRADSDSALGLVMREPVGVVAAVTHGTTR